MGYAIRIPANKHLELAIEDLLFRSPGRPSRKPLVRSKSFHYQADRWTTARRVVANVGELFPRVGFIVTNLPLPIAPVSDYSADAVLFTPNGPLKGHDPIREFFRALIKEFGQPCTTFSMQLQSIVGDFAYALWSAETADNVYEMATDTQVVRDGKIVAQSFCRRRSSGNDNVARPHLRPVEFISRASAGH